MWPLKPSAACTRIVRLSRGRKLRTIPPIVARRTSAFVNVRLTRGPRVAAGAVACELPDAVRALASVQTRCISTVVYVCFTFVAVESSYAAAKVERRLRGVESNAPTAILAGLRLALVVVYDAVVATVAIAAVAGIVPERVCGSGGV